MERVLLEYLVNSAWQVPLLAAAAWLGLRVGRASVRMQHWVWIAALAGAVLLPAVPVRHAADPRSVAVWRAVDPAMGRRAEILGRAPSVEDNALVGLGASSATAADAVAEPFPDKVSGWRLPEWATRVTAYLYLAVIGFGLVRLLCSWYAGRRMLRESRPAELSVVHAACLRRYCEELCVQSPEVRRSARAWSPVVIGARRPVLLLPESFAISAEPDVEAVWWHELVHVRRRDYLANLLCRCGALPITYHPAAHLLLRRVRRTRELVCDAVAAEKMSSRVAYARCLVELADRTGLAGVGEAEETAMFGDGALEERVMELLGTKQKASTGVRVLRAAVSVALFAAVAGAALFFHVTPTLAEARANEAQPVVAPMPVVEPVPVAAPVAVFKPKPVVAIAEPVEVQDRVAPQSVRPGQAAHGLSAEEQERVDKEIADGQRNVDDALKQLNNGELQKKVDEAMRSLNSGEMQKQIAEAMKQANTVNSAEMQKKVADAMARAQAQINSPEFRKRMEELNSPEFRKRIQEAVERAHGKAEMAVRSAEMQKHMAEMQSHIPEMVKEGSLTGARRSGSDKELYDSGMAALKTGNYEVARMKLQTLLNTYPESGFAVDAKRAIAQSWDAEGTLALVQADKEYSAAGVTAKALTAGVEPPKLIQQVQPDYTAEARAAKVNGTVVVNLWVDEQGNVQHVRVVRGLGLGLDEKAIDAVRQYKFKPAMEGGKPVMVALNVEVNFRIF